MKKLQVKSTAIKQLLKIGKWLGATLSFGAVVIYIVGAFLIGKAVDEDTYKAEYTVAKDHESVGPRPSYVEPFYKVDILEVNGRFTDTLVGDNLYGGVETWYEDENGKPYYKLELEGNAKWFPAKYKEKVKHNGEKYTYKLNTNKIIKTRGKRDGVYQGDGYVKGDYQGTLTKYQLNPKYSKSSATGKKTFFQNLSVWVIFGIFIGGIILMVLPSFVEYKNKV